ncbi:MAG: hypothetical protein ACREE4_17175, partial [Stellaceae bacterium]
MPEQQGEMRARCDPCPPDPRHGRPGQAFGIDPSRPHFYSLRQSRYQAVAADLDRWAAAAEGGTLSILDVGCGGDVPLSVELGRAGVAGLERYAALDFSS